MKKGKYVRLVSMVLVFVMVLSMEGCGKKDSKSVDQSGMESKGAGETAGTGKGIHLKYALAEELNSLDPNYNYSATSMNMIFNVNEGLYKYDSDGKVTYGMASKADVSQDGLTYTFTIRNDAYWTNGDKVTSKDFLYSWRRLADPKNGCTYAYMLITAGVKNAMNVVLNSKKGYTVDDLGISAPDDKTFVVKLDSPKSYFKELLAAGTCFMPVDQKFCEKCGDQFMIDMAHSIYCGPFVMSSWEVGGTTYTLKKNDKYYDKDSVTCDSVTYTLMTDAQQKILAWKSGQLDNLQISGDYISMYKDDPAIKKMKAGGMFFLSFNTKDKAISNKNLRLAISTAFDKKSIVDNILCDGSTPADYIIPDGFAKDSKGVTYRKNAGNPVYNPYDPDKAAKYWDAAKKELGVSTLKLELLYNEDSSLASIAAYIQSELQKTLPGLTVDLRCTTYNQRLQDMSKGNYQFGITRWYGDYQDAATFLDMWIQKSNLNYGKWYNKEYNDLYQKVAGKYAMDEKKRIAAQVKMEKIFLEDGGACPLYQPAFVFLENTKYNFVKTPAGIVLNAYTTMK
jgi:oligopeptide transport system substrate-binding protein